MLGRPRIKRKPPWMKINGLLDQLWMLVCMKCILSSFPLVYFAIFIIIIISVKLLDDLME
jgi:hypothetical protein